MSSVPASLLLLGSCLAAWWLTGRLRDYALAHQLIDVPNRRSSHAVATPRGGGVAIALTMLLALPLLGWSGAIPWLPVAGMMVGGAAVAIVGFVDDHRHVPAQWRLLVHFVAAACVLASLGGLAPLSVFGFGLQPDWIGNILALLYIVWVLNLTNFMDGIDGIAGLETASVCIGGAVLYLVAEPDTSVWLLPSLLASVTIGFLVWNWPPARVFMGDAGSGFVGLMLAVMSLQAGWVAPSLFWGWTILLGVFAVDATVTLLCRLARGETVYAAHRSHAYQHAARRVGAHRPITLAVGAINLFWLFPIAVLVALAALDGPSSVVVAYVPLVATALLLKAGTPAANNDPPQSVR